MDINFQQLRHSKQCEYEILTLITQSLGKNRVNNSFWVPTNQRKQQKGTPHFLSSEGTINDDSLPKTLGQKINDIVASI